ncbi:DNA helicase IV [Tamaricihabitans halophyticus]|uniref:DNA helicase IV n=1 Tax=Tamaricihabitans halophyticus TaxID=1262583 RepID=A0A4R2Q8E7_9PSEU|nr:helicase [Tamaricihabitans halophyticus]TCP45097.1 DNA helicase IV [Tamaricihabitans halophyticus]
MSNNKFDIELAAEQTHLDSLYARLDEECQAARARLDVALRDSSASSPQERWQRQVSVDQQTDRVRALRAAENGLCFGRLDDISANTSYIGRIGLFDETAGFAPLLVDWRAPAARPFYCSTVANPDGIRRRRHFRSNGRTITNIYDDVLSADDSAEQDGDSALLAVLNAPRVGKMRDIVATIQAEQDEIIRLARGGAVVIEGGPGTGKTAVALHRVAYLLYTHRDQLARRGVLLVGPNPDFLNYIGDVLPSLGETSAVFATPGDLHPGLHAVDEDDSVTSSLKGGLGMLDVLAAAVADRQELPDGRWPIELDDVVVTVDAKVARAARQRARDTGLLHNHARAVFWEWLIEELVGRAVRQIGKGWLTGRDTALAAELAADVRRELSHHPEVRRVVDRLWPQLTPERLLAELFTSPARIAAATPGMSDADRAALYRADGYAWTVADAALLDEAVELLGVDDRAERSRAERERQEHIEYTEGVLQVLETDDELDGEQLRATDLIDAEALAERHQQRDHRDIAQRAVENREWTYGHIVVDEAQELSEMAWRVLMRRCPSKSMTIVGDLAQRASAAGARTWSAMLDTYLADRWEYRQLTVNYRTPAEIMEVAAPLLAEIAPGLVAPESARSTGNRPRSRLVSADELDAIAAEEIAAASADGTSVVIAADGVSLDIAARVLSPRATKGLEFDEVVLVEPQRILSQSTDGAADLYVALTRATQRLTVLHTEPLPPVLGSLAAESEVIDTRSGKVGVSS